MRMGAHTHRNALSNQKCQGPLSLGLRTHLQTHAGQPEQKHCSTGGAPASPTGTGVHVGAKSGNAQPIQASIFLHFVHCRRPGDTPAFALPTIALNSCLVGLETLQLAPRIGVATIWKPLFDLLPSIRLGGPDDAVQVWAPWNVPDGVPPHRPVLCGAQWRSSVQTTRTAGRQGQPRRTVDRRYNCSGRLLERGCAACGVCRTAAAVDALGC